MDYDIVSKPSMFTFDNIADGETVHQRAVLVTGSCQGLNANEETVKVLTKTCPPGHNITFPENVWPVSNEGYFKALVLVSPGENVVAFGAGAHEAELRLTYIPLTQMPPLHLAVLVGQDSPLLVDCPPAKHAALSSAHSSLDAAVAKFRVTALMWQALTASELHNAGLGRRAFRLEEEWGVNTLSRTAEEKMGLVIRVHLVKSSKTVKELRDSQLAQQNPSARRANDLHTIFKQDLYKYGAPFVAEAKPIVAGLILDAKYDIGQDLILAHAALGSHDPKGLSLGIFGSHLAYSWPRFVEEIPSCLLDTTRPGVTVGNDNNECESMWEACTVGQGAFLHEVGHAFGAPHSTGIMMRGYSRDWAVCFLARTAKSNKTGQQGMHVRPDTRHACTWDLEDMLRFANQPQFALPQDEKVSREPAEIKLEEEDGNEPLIVVATTSSLVRIILDQQVVYSPMPRERTQRFSWKVDTLRAHYDRTKPLECQVLTSNGKKVTQNIWQLLLQNSYVRIPDTNIKLLKKSIDARGSGGTEFWSWTVMLKKRARDGRLVAANKINLAVGCILDGAEVYYKDGTKVPCSKRCPHESEEYMGGHQARRLALPKGVEITKVAVIKAGEGNPLAGLRMWLSNGVAMGALNKDHGAEVRYLKPGEGQVIVGFHGSSDKGSGYCYEFGIVTAPKGRQLPDSVYDMPELKNEYKTRSVRQPMAKRRKIEADQQSVTEGEESEEEDISQDEDTGYDDDFGTESESESESE
ncbi:metallopeptidase [Emericellopsis cladophorae]|uniref:Metallopeptidase n=1 Tax=Emericellopsis cladophorae TaxID=2686198 RepID=A0A9P9Y9D0_9HYPO|nr:metallopeptidase [Emericellopsis cladophorae]KAI6785968.1 metallopeptidase [Emericellopsis cladophorae]